MGAGPAGLAAATTLADRGHEVELFEARDHVGGQFDIAMRIPGKEEFAETIRYFTRRLDLTGVKVHLGRRVDADELADAGFDEVVVATGVEPRMPSIPGIEHPMVMTYAELVRGERTAGAARGRHRRRGHRRRRQRVPHDRALRRRSTPRRGAPSGASATRPRPAAALTRPATAAEPARRSCSSSARRPRSARAWARRPAGCTGPRSRPRASSTSPASRPTTASTTPACTSPWRPGRAAATEQRTYAVDSVVVCAGQESVRGLADALEARGPDHPRHRRCRRRGRARRQAGHPPGHRARRPHLTRAPSSGARGSAARGEQPLNPSTRRAREIARDTMINRDAAPSACPRDLEGCAARDDRGVRPPGARRVTGGLLVAFVVERGHEHRARLRRHRHAPWWTHRR